MSGTDVTVSLLRGFELVVDGQRVSMVWSAQRLVAYLALKSRPLTRGAVAGALWPESAALKANANLRYRIVTGPAGGTLNVPVGIMYCTPSTWPAASTSSGMPEVSMRPSSM